MSYDIAVPRYLVSEAKAAAIVAFWKTADHHTGNIPCQEDPELWFSTRGDDWLHASAACLTCPVQQECDQLANTSPKEKWGVWGGRPAGGRGGLHCVRCGHRFSGDEQSRRQYCSDACRVAARRDGKRASDRRRQQ